MLDVYYLSLEIIADLNPVLDELKRKCPHLHDQLDRSLTSTPLAIAEGSRSRGRIRNTHYDRGLTSMDESIAALAVAVVRKYIKPVDQVIIEKMKRVVGTLVKCTR